MIIRPKVFSQRDEVFGTVSWSWVVEWTDRTGRTFKPHFWTWPAALDFAVSVTFHLVHRGHAHLFQDYA